MIGYWYPSHVRSTFAAGLAVWVSLGCNGCGATTVDRRQLQASPLPVLRCMIPASEGSQLCYAPRDSAAAQRLLSPKPVDPSTDVEHAAHLSLRQIIVTRGGARTGTGPAVAITFIYGVPSLSVPPSRKSFVLITETPSRDDKRRAALTRDVVSGSRGTAYGPWRLVEGIPGSGLTVSVISNVGRRPVAQIGARMRHCDRLPRSCEAAT